MMSGEEAKGNWNLSGGRTGGEADEGGGGAAVGFGVSSGMAGGSGLCYWHVDVVEVSGLK
jgi:hypothetical protein